MIKFSHEALRQCALREVSQRNRVYNRLVDQQKMTQEKADREIAMMQAIADHFDELAGKDRLI